MSGVSHPYVNDRPVGHTNPMPVTITTDPASTVVALSSPPTSLTAGANTALTFASTVVR